MLIKTEQQAKNHAKNYLSRETLIVSESGDIYADCNVNYTSEQLDRAKQKYFILKGEKSVVKIKSKKEKLKWLKN